MEKLLCTWFGAGQMRPAPGTWASVVAVALGVLIHWVGHFPLLLVATLAVTLAGFWAVPRYTKGMEDPDRSEIVIDEVAGQWLALCFPSFGFWYAGLDATNFPYPGWLAALIFFRLFDIWKPWIIGRADRRGGVRGVMYDDLLAGLFAGIAVMIAAAFSHLVLM
ncbi:phosphatidylglycerophosphatase A family protein [Paracoccus sediminicola]|uniref:phosphatidylglycerophosphatase A family protein n=1 Tax=Paracoccus sediminicola TaxID=3017783 RepID=UPI0022F004DB|nr:phosphatidylglycerophosphatase A [Paracoccus sediminicola]WBU57756.1 phosphatidylglycerophosphatase A [Paracoccus sediminicola]